MGHFINKLGDRQCVEDSSTTLHTHVLSWPVAVVNPHPEVRSSGAVQCHIVYPSARPALQIMSHHWILVARLFFIDVAKIDVLPITCHHRWREGIAPLILNLGVRWGWS